MCANSLPNGNQQPVPFVDLPAQQERIRTSLDRRIHAVLDHGNYILGPEVSELEQRLADYTGVKHAVSCSSGTDALLMPLMAWGIGAGDAVFTTPFTFVATAEVIALTGATPIFVDIDPVTFNIKPAQLEAAIESVKKSGDLIPRVVIPVDLFGLPADYDAITQISQRHDLMILEDAAQAFGSTYGGKTACSFGDAAATSFFPAKPLGGYGDGGAVFTSNDELAAKLLSIRVHGQGTNKYDNVRIGLNARLDTLQAAVLLSKLEIFDDELGARQSIAQAYSRGIASVSDTIVTPSIPEGSTSAWAQYSILTASNEQRQKIQSTLRAANIPSAIYYQSPLHLQSAFAYLNCKKGDFPVSESTSNRILSLPMHPYLNSDQISRTIDLINS